MNDLAQGRVGEGRVAPARGVEAEWRLSDLLTFGAVQLQAAGIDEPRREARLLLSHATQLEGAALLRYLPCAYPAPGYPEFVARRARREPLAYILGHQPFWTLDLLVSADTLIPRADSETLVEVALDAFPARKIRHVLDLGTGTGCLLLAALSEYPAAWGVGVDLSPAACRLARRNACRNRLGKRSAFVCGDWSDAVAGGFDVVLANPPYIPTPDLDRLMPEVVGHEPMRALDGGEDGLQAYRRLMPAIAALLRPAGLCVLEVGIGQADAVVRLGVAAGLVPAGQRADLGGVTRAVLLEAAGPGGAGAEEKTFGTTTARR